MAPMHTCVEYDVTFLIIQFSDLTVHGINKIGVKANHFTSKSDENKPSGLASPISVCLYLQ